MILFFDTETTGLWNFKAPVGDPTQPRLVQLGAILDDGAGEEVMRLDVILYRHKIPDEAAATHGITTEFSQRVGLTETAALQVFEDMVDAADTIVAHNIEFDVRIIKHGIAMTYGEVKNDPFAGKNMFCTMRASTPICRLPKRGGGLKPPKLIEAHQHFTGEGFDKAHRAINDVLACRRVFWGLQALVKKA